jgi:UDP-glucose 4-epimerase
MIDVRNARILIAGAASLVGSHTAELLLTEGAKEVILLDNFAFGDMSAIEHLTTDSRVRIVRCDIMNLHDLLEALKDVDAVVHLAAYMTLGFAQAPWKAIDVNLRGVQNMLEASVIRSVKRFVFASSNAVYGYGSGVKGALLEDVPFHSVGAPPAAILYGASKIMGEQLCRQYFQTHKLSYVVLRYSTVYGERQHYRAANSLYIMETYDSVKAGRRPLLAGDGNESKHFVHVSDVARANLAAIVGDAEDVAVNVSGPDPITTRELVGIVTDYCGSDLEPETRVDAPGTVRLTSGGAFHIPNTAAKAALGWEPRVSMSEGVGRLLDWRDQQQSEKGR